MQTAATAIDVSTILQRLAACSTRLRYTFMVLNLISEAAGPSGSVGPTVTKRGACLTVRDWLSDALAPMAARDGRRSGLVARAADALACDLLADPQAAAKQLADAVDDRARKSGKANVSRAVSDLVRAGLVRRHYAGWCKDHQNRGGQRQAVYTVNADALAALRRHSMFV